MQRLNTARMRRVLLLLATLLWMAPVARPCVADDTSPAVVGFNRHIRPILSDKCFHCHGPDKAIRQGELRLDDARDVRRDRDGQRVLTAGKPDESELFRRITHEDEAERMPPAESGKTLSATEIELIRRWIEQGGEYEQLWSLIPPTRRAPPTVKLRAWPRGPLDHFALARMEREGLRPTARANRATLIRRVTFDLTGLPPAPAEVESFLADVSPNAYERVVERLLASPRYGENMARYWLDIARYADTNGFFTDDERFMWRWRDWVINAYNANMPFDRFTVEQLAGDLLPKPTLRQLIATGFNRNHMTTHETGVIDEEYRVEYVVDRLNTTATAWLGLSVGCARCHDHKYDPITQRDFYRLFAFFNNGPVKGNTGGAGNASPVLPTPSPEFKATLEQLRRKLAAADSKLKAIEPRLAAAQAKWEKTALAALSPPTSKGLVAHFNMESRGADASGSRRHADTVGSVEFSPGLLGTAAKLDGNSVLESPRVGFERDEAFSYGAWVYPETGAPACVLSKSDDLNSLRGFDLMLRKGKAVVHLASKWGSNAIQLVTRTPIPRGRWGHLMVTYDGSSKASGVRIYLDGKRQPVKIRRDHLTGTIQTDQPLRIGRRSTSAAFVGLIDDVRIYNRELAAADVESLVMSQFLRGAISTPPEKRSSFLKQRLRDLFLSSDPRAAPLVEFQWVRNKALGARQELAAFQKSLPTTMVMRELAQPRETFLLVRGQYDQRGEKLTPGVPQGLPALPVGAPPNRLGLARWLIDRSHPLTARVSVNRLWRQFFGTGIVESVEDFGSQGEWPSHPDLLDWLAVEFMDSGWDVKALQKRIVMSATYQQSSRSTPEMHKRDPGNRLLARGPRFRLDAEALRDNALAISGLLVDRIGGPSVKPYQPPGVWEAVSYDGDLSYEQDHGEALFRRGFYTFWKRQSPPPVMLALDAPTRETCTARRARTNTPLAALALMNDTVYVEAARVFASRVLTTIDGSPEARMQAAFRLATARTPDKPEMEVLMAVYRKQLAVFHADQRAAEELLRVGESPRNASIDLAQHAAWTVMCNVLLNLDETMTKN